MCAGDLQYAIDASGQHMCEWKCPKNSMPAEIASMGLSSANLNELKRLAPELEELHAWHALYPLLTRLWFQDF